MLCLNRKWGFLAWLNTTLIFVKSAARCSLQVAVGDARALKLAPQLSACTMGITQSLQWDDSRTERCEQLLAQNCVSVKRN